jgi:hypothetical protein
LEDPDKTGLGNALASLIGRRLLLASQTESIGILRYEGSLAPTAAEPLSYFDKVDMLAKLQDVTLAIWGMVRGGTTRGISVDIFLQIPPRVLDESFSWGLSLPAAMGGGKLIAHLRPPRMQVVHFESDHDAVASIVKAAAALDHLRKEPSETGADAGSLPIETPYWISQRHDDWILLATGTQEGWVQSGGNCVSACDSLIESATFAAQLIDFISSRHVSEPSELLKPDARAALAQMTILEHLDTATPGTFQTSVLDPLEVWRHRENSPLGLSGGLAFANILALSKVLTAVYAAVPDGPTRLAERLKSVAVRPAAIRTIADELAAASQLDPRNTDILHNLAVLFRYGHDESRAALADQLLQSAVP